MTIKFLWNGIKINGRLHRCRYARATYTPQSGLPAGTITLYARDHYPGLPRLEGMAVKNDSDGASDYFETDTGRILPDSLLYPAALDALKKQAEHRAKREAKWRARRGLVPLTTA